MITLCQLRSGGTDVDTNGCWLIPVGQFLGG